MENANYQCRSTHTKLVRRQQEQSWTQSIRVLLAALWFIGITWALSVTGVFPQSLVKPLGLWFVLITVITGILMTAEQVPLRKCIIASIITYLWMALINFGSATIGVPLGNVIYADAFGTAFNGKLTLLEPATWVAVIFIGRGIGKAIMRPWHKLKYYGFWVLGITCVVGLIYELTFSPIATHVLGFAFWNTEPSVPAWYGEPWISIGARVAMVMILLLIITPILLPKGPTLPRSRFFPIIAWLGIQIPLGVILVINGMWAAVISMVCSNVPMLWFAVRGALW